MSNLARWPRRHYAAGGGQPYLFWTVFGQFDPLALDPERHRSAGCPGGIRYERISRGEVRDPSFLFRDTWAEVARDAHPGLLDRVRGAPQRVVLEGTVQNDQDLDYLRDVVGLVACLLEQGGVGVADVLAYKWWSAEAFRERVFEPNAPTPFEHVSILSSPESSGTWLYSRGMRVFGRPDVSIRGLSDAEVPAGVEMINRFIVGSAEGIRVREGELLEMELLSGRWVCHHRGHLDDPAFNNVHIEVLRS